MLISALKTALALLGSSSVDSSIKFRLPDTGSCCKPDTRIIYKDFNERIIYLRPGADNRFLVCTSRPCGVMDVNPIGIRPFNIYLQTVDDVM